MVEGEQSFQRVPVCSLNTAFKVGKADVPPNPSCPRCDLTVVELVEELPQQACVLRSKILDPQSALFTGEADIFLGYKTTRATGTTITGPEETAAALVNLGDHPRGDRLGTHDIRKLPT